MSENIFRELYTRVLSLFKQSESKEENAKEVACNRLRVVLMQDRTNLTPELLQRMRKELVELLSKYVEMDKDALELNFDQDGDQMALMLSIPVIRAKDEEEINKALEEQDKSNKEESESEEETEDENDDETESDEDTEDESENDDKEETSEDEVEIVEETEENTSKDEGIEVEKDKSENKQ